MDSFAFLDWLQRDPLSHCPKQSKVWSLKSKLAVLMTILLSSTGIDSSIILWLLCLRQLLTTTSPTSSSLFVNSRSDEVLPLVGSLTSCLRRLSSTHSRNFLDCLLSAVLYFSKYWLHFLLCPPWEQGLVIVWLLLAACTTLNLSLHLGWTVFYRLSPGCLPHWPSPSTYA